MYKETNKIILILITVSTALILNLNKAYAETAINYRQEMRDFVILISKRAKLNRPGFYIIPQNALDLITEDGNPDGRLIYSYLNAIDGTGREELFYGYSGDGRKNLKNITDYFLNYLLLFKKENKKVLAIDYTTNMYQAFNSYRLCREKGFISFQANRKLTKIPDWNFNMNDNEINTLSNAENFLYLLNTSEYNSRINYLNALRKTGYDILLIDACFWKQILTRKEIRSLQTKPSGKKRLVICYMSIGEAETYRYYWKQTWGKNPPAFLEKENPEWKGNYKVKYWHEQWKEIICGRTDGTGFQQSYLKKIIDAGFNGVYMDIIDAAHYFENK